MLEIESVKRAIVNDGRVIHVLYEHRLRGVNRLLFEDEHWVELQAVRR